MGRLRSSLLLAVAVFGIGLVALAFLLRAHRPEATAVTRTKSAPDARSSGRQENSRSDSVKTDPSTEARETGSRTESRSPTTTPEAGKPEPFNALEHRKARLIATILDTSLTPAKRVQELQSLKGLKGITPEVSESMLQLLKTSDDPGVRVAICSALAKSYSKEHRQAMVALLMADKSSRVRVAAARSLADYNGEEAVIKALEDASKNDADRRVRRESQNSLKSEVQPARF